MRTVTGHAPNSRIPTRIEIERALDELVSYEEGFRFQHLAVILAKQRWPELIASEPKKDHGLDLIGTPSCVFSHRLYVLRVLARSPSRCLAE